MAEDPLTELIENLSSEVDDLEDALEPILGKDLQSIIAPLSSLEQGKFYVQLTYTIESILFSYLMINGIDAKAHPVFTELTRVKQYFEKVKAAESGPEKRKTAVDREAASRFIKAALSGNSQYDRERAEREEKARLNALQKLEALDKKRAAEDLETSAPTEDAADTADESEIPKKKKMKKSKQEKAAAKASKLSRKKSSKPPLNPKEAFQQLLKGPLPKDDKA